MTITFIGHGYVGLVTAAVFADLGNTVWVVGRTQEKIENLKRGKMPFFEPGLEETVRRNQAAGRKSGSRGGCNGILLHSVINCGFWIRHGYNEDSELLAMRYS